MSIAIHKISAESFADLGGGSIEIARQSGPPLRLNLCDVRPLGAHGPRLVPAFSALLSAPDGTQLAQGLYVIDHPTLGRLELFLAPIGMQPDGPGYEIVFN